MKTIKIKGKDYVMVNERILYFREQEAFENWQIVTDIITVDVDNVVMKASIVNPEGVVMATGHGQEFAGSTFINKTSYVENCETSAIGRALAVMGIGIDTSMASFEEVANAVTQQADDRKWLNDVTYNSAIKGMNTIAEKEDRQKSYDYLDKTYKMKREYRERLLDLVNETDIPGLDQSKL